MSGVGLVELKANSVWGHTTQSIASQSREMINFCCLSSICEVALGVLCPFWGYILQERC